MPQRKCICCGTIIGQYNPGNLCFACQEKMLDERFNANKPNYDVNDVANLMGLSTESIRRKAREGKLPPRIPETSRWLWVKDLFDSWIRSGHLRIFTAEAREAILIAQVIGYPIPEGTLYGYDIDNLISDLKALGYMPDKKSKN